MCLMATDDCTVPRDSVCSQKGSVENANLLLFDRNTETDLHCTGVFCPAGGAVTA